jgi:DNA modification methylase
MTALSPYYMDDLVALYHGDSRRILKAIPSDSVGLVVTSPPYNAKIRYDAYEDWLPWKEYWHGLIEPVLRECYRVLVPGGRICLNLANVVRVDDPQPGRKGRATQYSGRPDVPHDLEHNDGPTWPLLIETRIWPLLEAIGFLARERVTWLKADQAEHLVVSNNSTAWGSWCSASNPVLRAVAEPVFIASKGSHARERRESDLTPDEFKAWTRNAWLISQGHRDQSLAHPAMFPIELPRRLIKLYSYPGDTVCDPFAGVGTTLRAAKNLGRRTIGIELSEGYCRIAAGRCAQDTLFGALA